MDPSENLSTLGPQENEGDLFLSEVQTPLMVLPPVLPPLKPPLLPHVKPFQLKSLY
jgi:hypothetical protein